jgi:hypothetical protein
VLNSEPRMNLCPPPITLMGGVQEQISGMDLQAYLEPANLIITGMDPTQFAVSRKLPEGIYQFTIEAVEYRRLKTVSNPGTAVAWLILNDPPIWNLPQHNSIITATNPQNIFYSWLPLHKGSPNSAFTTEYEFALYDIIPQDRNPDDAVNTGIPIYQSNTMANSLVYGPADPPLEIGRKYACRVKAYDTEGRDMFKNDGYSTVLVFTYGQECLTPVGISHEVTGPFSATVSWAPLPGNTEFILEYREKTEDGTSAWYTDNAYNNSADIDQLKPVTNYEYKLKALCGSIESDYSILYEFSTPVKESDSIDCGTGPGVPEIDNSPPLQKLYIGDVINVGGFEGIVTQARGSNGVFTGKCIMRLTNFNILLKSHFTDISINESYQVTEGNVIADRGPGIMINLDNIEEEIDSLASIEIERDSIFDDPGEYLEDLEIIYTIDPEIVTDSLAEDLEEIREDLTELSESEDLTEEQINAIEDLLNQIDNLLNGGSNQNQDNPSFVMFKASPDQEYGFDEPNPEITSLLQYYQPPNTIEGKEQLIRWKSVREGFPDEVYAHLDSVHPNLKFYNEAGTEIGFQNSAEDTIKIVTVTGTQEGLNGSTTDRIYSRINVNDSTSIDAGVLNIVTYQEDVKELIIIPVNGNSLPSGLGDDQFFELLNNVYGQAVIKWNKYHIHAGIDFDYAAADEFGTFDAWPESGQQYSPDMQALINTYMQNESFDQEHYYVFLVDNPENAIQLGIMPFFQNFAFIYVDKVSQTETFVKTVAHELGHGAFGLLHPFKRHEGIDEFGYENLMTYHPTATRLHAYQWNLIQYPQWFLEVDYGSAEDAGAIQEYYLKLIDGLGYRSVSESNSFLSPAGYPIRIPEIIKASFTRNGGIRNFILNNNNKYLGIIGRNNDQFYGYISDNKKEEFFTQLNDTTWDAPNLVKNNLTLIERLKPHRFNGVENADVDDDMLVYFQKEENGMWLDCILEVKYKNHFFFENEDYIGKANPFTIPDYATSIKTAGGECGEIYENDNLLNNNAEIFYYSMVENISTLEEKNNLTDLCNFLGYDNREGVAYYFADGDNPENHTSFPTGQALIDYLKENSILSINAFNDKFDHQLQTEDHLIYSIIDFEIPEDYNTNSIDWVKYRTTGEILPYEYTFADIYKRQNHKNINSVIWTAIDNYEEDNEAIPINTEESYEQYTACFNTESAIFSWMQFFAEGMSDVLEVGVAYNAVRVVSQMFRGGNKKQLSKILIGDIKQKLYTGNNLDIAIDAIPNTNLKNYASSLKNSDNVLLKEIAENSNQVSVFSNNMDEFAEIAKFEDNFLKVGDNAWADDAIEATNVQSIADDVPLKNSAGDDITGQVEMIEDADGRVWFRMKGSFDELFDLTTFKNLSGQTPTGNKWLVNFKFSDFADATKGMKVEKSVLEKIDGVSSKLNQIKTSGDYAGNLTEEIAESIMREKGYTVIKDIGKYGSNNGYDIVAFKGSIDNPTEVIIIEGKQFKQGKLAEFDESLQTYYDEATGLRLNNANEATGLPTQMSKSWVFDFVGQQKLLPLGGNKTQLALSIENNRDIVERYVFAIDKSEGNGYFLKLGDF